MEQRRLRLGDILDDYCPRERRVTNHAVVAMVEEDVKQTRCTTCDAEHVYKGGHAPRRRKTETTGKLYKQVLAGITDQETAASSVEPSTMDDPEHDHAPQPIDPVAEVIEAAEATQNEDGDRDRDADAGPGAAEPDAADVDGPVHRPLIRAQLPRIEGVKAERQAPDFTIRQNSGRGNGQFRGGDMRARGGQGGGNNGQRFGRGPHRGGGRGGGQGFGRGPGGGNQPRHGGGGRKRGR
jgi:hypothetical protein